MSGDLPVQALSETLWFHDGDDNKLYQASHWPRRRYGGGGNSFTSTGLHLSDNEREALRKDSNAYW